MELVPIITQILGIVAAVFVIVLLFSFVASKLRKKENQDSLNVDNYNNQQSYNYVANNVRVNKEQYYGGNYSSSSVTSYPKEIKVVRRSGISNNQPAAKYRPVPTNSNSRFTVINSISGNDDRTIETDEYGFKIYPENEITRSVYLPN